MSNKKWNGEPEPLRLPAPTVPALPPVSFQVSLDPDMNVRLEFSRQINWLAMAPAAARKFATGLLVLLDKLEAPRPVAPTDDTTPTTETKH